MTRFELHLTTRADVDVDALCIARHVPLDARALFAVRVLFLAALRFFAAVVFRLALPDVLEGALFWGARASNLPLFTHSRTLNHVVLNFFAASPKDMPPLTALTTRRRKSSV